MKWRTREFGLRYNNLFIFELRQYTQGINRHNSGSGRGGLNNHIPIHWEIKVACRIKGETNEHIKGVSQGWGGVEGNDGTRNGWYIVVFISG